LLFNNFFEYAIRKVDEIQEGLELNDIYQFLAYADDVNLLNKYIHTTKKKREALLGINTEVHLVQRQLSIHSCLTTRMQDKVTI